MKRLALLSVLAVSFTACGSSDGQAATASEGDSFCKLAQVAKDDNDALDSIDPTDPASAKVQLSGAIDSLTAVAAAAPKDIADTVKKLLASEVKLEQLLKDNDFDFEKFAASDEGKKLLADDSITKTGEELDAYLSDKCAIATDTSSVDTTPVDDTVVSSETIATSDTVGSGVSIDLGEGADAINKFLDFYELGTGASLSDSDRQCIVDALVDKVSGQQLSEAIAGQASEELNQALGLAFIGCKVTVES
jgi:flagellar capping protein FliD